MGASAERIRVLLAEMPPLLCGIVRETLENEPDITVVAELARGAALHPALTRARPDVVVVGTIEPGGFAIPRGILASYPLMRVLMLADTGRSAVMYELVPHHTPLGEVSPRALLDAIRFGGRARPGIGPEERSHGG